MATGKPTKMKGKPRRKPKGTPRGRCSQTKREANRRNSQKSTGLRTREGKGRSRFNAVTHGLTARSALLPDDDPAKLAELRRELLNDLRPRDGIEATLIVRVAEDKWIIDRSQRSVDLHAVSRVRNQPGEQTGKEKDEALELAENLFWELARPLPLDRGDYKSTVGAPPLAGAAVHPAHPARIRLRLERTTAGCDWLLEQWMEPHRRLNAFNAWQPKDVLKTVRLLGKHAIDIEEDFEVATALMCSVIVINAKKAAPMGQPSNWPVALTHLLAEFGFEGRELYINQIMTCSQAFQCRLGQLPLVSLAPRDGEQAREWLTAIIDRELERVRNIQTALQAIRQADAAEALGRCWFDTGPEAELHRRYLLSNKRVLNRSIGNYLNARKQELAERNLPDSGDVDPAAKGRQFGGVSLSASPSDRAATPDCTDATTVAGVCDPGGPSEPGLAEACYNAPSDRTATPDCTDATTVAGVCDPGGPSEPGLAEAGYSNTACGLTAVGVNAPPCRALACEIQFDTAMDHLEPCVVERASTPDDAIADHIERESPVVTTQLEAGCGEELFLRNEAKPPFVGGPLSVVGGPSSFDPERVSGDGPSSDVSTRVSVVGGQSDVGDGPSQSDEGSADRGMSKPRDHGFRTTDAPEADDEDLKRKLITALLAALWKKKIASVSDEKLRAEYEAEARKFFATEPLFAVADTS